jgi:hypothetical protein
MNLGYLDPRTIKVEDWKGREDERIKVVPTAGETLHRVTPIHKFGFGDALFYGTLAIPKG